MTYKTPSIHDLSSPTGFKGTSAAEDWCNPCDVTLKANPQGDARLANNRNHYASRQVWFIGLLANVTADRWGGCHRAD